VASRAYASKVTAGTGRRAHICAFALLSVLIFAADGNADSLDTGWRTETGLYLTGTSHYLRQNDAAINFDTMAATAEFRFVSDVRPYYAGLFVDYGYSADSRFDGRLNLGGYFKYQLNRWDATAYMFVNKSPAHPDTWLYAGRLRYRVSDRHKLGIRTMATFRDPDEPELMLGYFGSISDSLSLNVLVGAGINAGPDLAAQLELSWQIH